MEEEEEEEKGENKRKRERDRQREAQGQEGRLTGRNGRTDGARTSLARSGIAVA